MDLDKLLTLMVHKDGSDLFLTTGAPPSSKIYGKLVRLANEPCPPGLVRKVAESVMTDEQVAEFHDKPEMNLAHSINGVGRFRVNIFKQRHEYAMVIRYISTEIPSYEQLGLPEVLTNLVMQKRGLILFVGATGSGKSTSLAALIDYRNKNSSGHIITIEDPVEFVHRHQGCIVNQREVGSDTDCYEDALKNTLRQAPDVILIGEIRAADTMEHAINFAETGHLCLSTLHANNANQALDRIINFFPEEKRNQLLLDLSLNLCGIVSQRLIPTVDGKRAAAIEILINTPLVADLIKKGDVAALKEVMDKSGHVGMQTFDNALLKLWREKRVTTEEAIKNADSKNNLRLKMTLGEKKSPQAAQPEQKSSAAEPPPEPPKQSSFGSSLSLVDKPEDNEDEDEKGEG